MKVSSENRGWVTEFSPFNAKLTPVVVFCNWLSLGMVGGVFWLSLKVQRAMDGKDADYIRLVVGFKAPIFENANRVQVSHPQHCLFRRRGSLVVG